MVSRQSTNINNSALVPTPIAANHAALQRSPKSTSVKDKARSDMLKTLAQIRPAFAEEIRTADFIDRTELNGQAEELVKALAIVNQEWNVVIQEYNDALSTISDDPQRAERFAVWRETQWSPDSDKSRRVVELRSFAPALADVEEKMEDVMQRRHVLSTNLRNIQEKMDAPLFARMMCAADLIRWNIHALAAEVLLDLIEIASNDGEKSVAKENNRAEWFLRKIASLYRLKWLDQLIEVKPPEVSSYRKLRATMLLASMGEPLQETGSTL